MRPVTVSLATDAVPAAVAGDGGYLVTKALAAARRHQHQGVAAVHHMLDDGLLLAAKMGVAEDLVQDGQRLGGGVHGF